MWINTPENIEDYVGFVYLITNITKNKYYIGQKKFWSKRTLPPLKGKTRKRKKIVESDWIKYTGSSEELNKDILAGDEIKKEIIRVCKSKWEMNYYEIKEQIDRDVLFKECYYNGIVNVRIARPPKLLIEEYESCNKISEH